MSTIVTQLPLRLGAQTLGDEIAEEMAKKGTLNHASYCGVTDWNDGAPPCPGWWNARRLDWPRKYLLRRWWNGKLWSYPVMVAAYDDDEAELLGQMLAGSEVQGQIQWQGLLAPAPIYPYNVGR